MKLHWWIEVRGKKKIVFYLFAAIAIILFCTQLPPEAWRLRGRQFVPTPVTMSSAWLAGWFLLFFVRAENLHVSAPFDYQTVYRLAGAVLLVIALFFVGLFYVVYW